MAVERSDWEALADDLEVASVRLAETARFDDSKANRLAIALLCRTIGHMGAIQTLIETKSVVEARVISRCCLENLFWIGGLAAKGEAFVKQMEDDNDVNKQKLGNALLESSKKQGVDAELEGKLEAFLDELKAKERKEIEDAARKGEKKANKGTIGFKTEADHGKTSQAYIFYRQLSGDAAHPSATSLSRHIDEFTDPEHPTFSGDPIVGPGEPEETFQIAAMALLGVCIVANDMLNDGKPLPDNLEAIKNRFLALNAKAPVPSS